MAWSRARFKGQKIWAEVDGAGQLAAAGGRVAIRYSKSAGAKVYRAGSGRVELLGEPPEDLPDGAAADDRAGGGRKKKASGRGSGFGSAGSRTAQQAAMAEAAAKQLIASLADDAVVVFTDGACRGNPGPAGSGALVQLPDGRRGESCKALGTATNNVGELTAIGLALDLLEGAEVDPATTVAVLTDSKYTHGVLVQGWKAKANRELILGLRDRLTGWPNLRLHWVAGHVGIDGNERADALANLGVDGVSRVRWLEA